MYSLCLDCGATNVRAMVVDKQGAIVGKASQPNATLPGEEIRNFTSGTPTGFSDSSPNVP